MKRSPRPPLRVRDARERDFEWPPDADSLESGEFVSLDEDVFIASPQRRARPPLAGLPALRASAAPARKAGPGEELVWPPPSDDLETVEIGAAPDVPTLVAPPRPRGPRIEAVIDRPSRASQRTSPRPGAPANVQRAGPSIPRLALERRLPAALQAAVLGLAVVSVGALGVWAVGRAAPAHVDGRPGIVAPPAFRTPARAQVPVPAIERMQIDAPLWPADRGASVRSEPLLTSLADAEPPRADEPSSEIGPPASPPLEAPTMPAGAFNPTLLPAGQPVDLPTAPTPTERPDQTPTNRSHE